MKAAEFHQARKFADTTFGRIAYVEKGAGPVALFIHGFPVNGFAWRDVLDDLAPARRCIALDLMGLGYTEIKADQDLGFDQQAAMIAAFMDRLGLSQVDLVGNDSGASISQVFAARYPSRLRSLTLTNCEVHDLWPNAMLKAAFDQFADPSIIIGMKTMLDAPAVARQAFASVYEDAERIPDEAFKMYFEAALASEDRSNNLRRFLSLGNLKVLTAIAPQLRELKVPDVDRVGRGRHRLRSEIAGLAQEQYRQRAAGDYGAARKTIFPRGASQADERAAAGILAQHRVSRAVTR